MLRFIDLTGQITEDVFEFAWYDTATDKFLDFEGSQTWQTWDDFVLDWDPDKHTQFPLERFAALFPATKSEGDDHDREIYCG